MSFSKYVKSTFYTFLILAVFVFCKQKNDNLRAEPGLRIQTVVTNYGIIWGMDFLPDGDMLFTEKSGKIHRYHAGKTTEITGVPAVNTNGQGGLLDIKVHPDYA